MAIDWLLLERHSNKIGSKKPPPAEHSTYKGINDTGTRKVIAAR